MTPTTPMTVLALHGLGGAAATFGPLADHLPPELTLVPIDLPGFGSAADDPRGGDLRSMTDAAIARAPRDLPWVVLGHSMGGKVALLVAAALAGTAIGPSAAVLLAGSPATPEPMPDDKREQMIGWARTGLTAERAEQFLDDDCASPLPAAEHSIAVGTITASAPRAWESWFTRGSREDVSEETAGLALPALVLGGTEDETLGAAAQPALQARSLPNARHVALPATGHQIPLERPHETAEQILRFIRTIPSTTDA
ncbi:alpha/beta fold hydrolase [Mycetocola reblochoni]|uniref:Alpha/beta hydrolase fold n=2 Tax=Mycetocola reblochoni TaxID=331618 RepID=A0A1R4KD71_9MICO|nr:alpha/beta hydrolase [Mycetocola reblochoni]SJN42227.1 Alpha/beta hydrolase fold [Mycetocola reblochoni REB411]